MNLPGIPQAQDPVRPTPSALPSIAPQGPAPSAPPREREPFDIDVYVRDTLLPRRKQRLMESYRAALKTDPAFAAEAKKIARQLGIDETMVSDSFDVAQEQARVLSVAQQDLERTSPTLARMMELPSIAKVAHDDTEALAALEKTTGFWSRNMGRGEATNALGAVGFMRMMRLMSAEDAEAELPALRLRLARMPEDEGFTASFAELAGQMWQTAGVSAGVGTATSMVATPAAGVAAGLATQFTLSSVLEAGAKYQELIDAGVPHETAFWTASGHGALTGALEYFAGKISTGPLRKAFGLGVAGNATTRALTRQSFRAAALDYGWSAVKTVAAETAQETLTEVQGFGASQLARGISGLELEDSSVLGQNIAEVAKLVSQGMVPFALLGPMAQGVRDYRGALEAGRATQAFAEMAKRMQAVKLATRDPETAAEMAQAMADDSGNGRVFLDGKEALEVLRQLGAEESKAEATKAGITEKVVLDALPPTGETAAQMNKLIPGIVEKIVKAAQEGTDVEIPTGEILAKLANTEMLAALTPVIRFRKSDRSTVAMKYQFSPELIQSMQKDLVKTAKEVGARNQKIADEASEIRTEYEAQLKETGRYKPDQVKAAAELLGAFITTQADAMGVTPREFATRMRAPTIRRGETGQTADALAQTDFDSPEFKAWFGDSKVVDEGGKPLTVFHGSTTEGVVELTPENAVEVEGAVFFSDNREVAKQYQSEREYGEIVGDPVGDLVEAHLSMRNPMVVDMAGAPGEAIRVGKLVKQAKAAGHDGLILQNVDDTVDSSRQLGTTYAVFSPTQIKSVNNRGTFDPNDPNILRQGNTDPLAEFNVKASEIILSDKANFSSVVHEMAHWFLEAYAKIASLPNAPAHVTQDMQTLLDFFKVKDIAAWNALSLEQKRKHHESIAYNFENYLFDGKAPSVEMRGLFRRMASWMRSVYRGIRNAIAAGFRQDTKTDLPELTQEVRGVFDRMLAAQEAIETREASDGLLPMFQTKEQFVAAGYDEKKWDAYAAKAAEARAAAIEELQAKSLRAFGKSLRAFGWSGRMRGRILKGLDKEAAAERERVQETMEAQVRGSGSHRAWRFMRRGENWNPDGTEQSGERSSDHKVNREVVTLLLGEADAKKLDSVLTDGAGTDLGTLAEFMGFDDAMQMLRAVIDDGWHKPETTVEKKAEAMTEVYMQDHHDPLVNPNLREEAVTEALHNEVRQQMVAAELAFLTDSVSPAREMLAAADETAFQTLQKMALKDINLRHMQQALANARSQADRAGKQGKTKTQEAQPRDSATAAEWKRRELLQERLLRQARDVRKDVEAAVELFRKIFRGDAKVMRGRDVDLVTVAREILSRVGLAPGAQQASPAAMEALQMFNAPLYERVKGLIDYLTAGKTTDYKNLTVQEFTDLTEVIEGLWHEARTEKSRVIAGKEVSDEAIEAELLERIPPSDQAPPGAKERQPPGFGGWMKSLFSKAAFTRVEHWARAVDGGKTDGPFMRYVFRPVRKAFDSYLVAKNVLVRQLRDIIASVPPMATPYYSKDLDYKFTDNRELLGFLSHVGNSSNKDRLARGGRGQGSDWGREQTEEGGTDYSKVDAAVAAMVKDGVLTQAHFDAVQAVWDMNEALKPEIQKAHRRRYGFNVKWVETQGFSVTFPDGTTKHYRGGYVPARIDKSLTAYDGTPPMAVLNDPTDQETHEFRNSLPSTGRSMTIERTGATYPLVLDIGAQLAHLDATLRFIHLQNPVYETGRLLKRSNLFNRLNAFEPGLVEKMLFPWLQTTALNQVMRPSENKLSDRVLSALRRSVGAGRMFANVVNAVQQVTGLSHATQYVKASSLFAAAGELRRSWGETTRFIQNSSVYMDERLHHVTGQLMDDVDLTLSAERGRLADFEKFQGFIQQHAYIAQRMVQNQVDRVTWLAAYNESKAASVGLDEAAAHEKAVDHADSMVRLSQGSSTAPDMSMMEKGTAAARLFFMFVGYFNAALNQIVYAQPGSDRAKAVLRAYLLPALGGAFLATLLNQDFTDEDEDGNYFDDLAWWTTKALGRQALSMAPPAGGVVPVGPMLSSLFGSGGQRVGLSPAVDAFQTAFDGLWRSVQAAVSEERDANGYTIRNLLRGVGDFAGVPLDVLGRAVGYAVDVAQDRVFPTGGLDYARGLVTGRASAGTTNR